MAADFPCLDARELAPDRRAYVGTVADVCAAEGAAADVGLAEACSRTVVSAIVFCRDGCTFEQIVAQGLGYAAARSPSKTFEHVGGFPLPPNPACS